MTEKPGALLPPELAFRGEDGAPALLGDFFDGEHPVVLTLAYFDCTMLCPLVLGTIASLLAEEEDPGSGAGSAEPVPDFRLLSVSIDPRDTPADAARAGATFRGAAAGRAPEWSFLTTAGPDAATLAEAVGFGYHFDSRSDQFAHPAVIFILTPAGRVAHYLYGLEIAPERFREALRSAARHETGSLFDRVLLRCFHYVPALRRFEPLLNGSLRVGGSLILLSLLGGVSVLVVRARVKEEGR